MSDVVKKKEYTTPTILQQVVGELENLDLKDDIILSQPVTELIKEASLKPHSYIPQTVGELDPLNNNNFKWESII